MRYRSILLLVSVAFLADAMATYHGLGAAGLYETNPFLVPLMDTHGTLPAIVLLSVASFSVIVGIAQIGRYVDLPGTAMGSEYGLLTVAGMKFAFAGWNAILILRTTAGIPA